MEERENGFWWSTIIVLRTIDTLLDAAIVSRLPYYFSIEEKNEEIDPCSITDLKNLEL